MSETRRYMISLCGCDDTTQFHVELDETEAALVRRLVALAAEASGYGCMPTMEIKEVGAAGNE